MPTDKEDAATHQGLRGWLQVEFEAHGAGCIAEGTLDAQYCSQADRLSNLVDEWGLRAWVREARRVDQG